MKLPNDIDLTSGGQKMFAGFLIVLVLCILYVVTPPLVVLFKNLWMLALYGVPMLFLVYNYGTVWHWFKKASWELTKWSISKDKPGYLYKFHTYLLVKNDDLRTRLRNLKATRENVNRQMLETGQFISQEKNYRMSAAARGALGAISSSDTKIKMKQSLLDKLIPRYDFIVKQEKTFTEVLELRTKEADDLKFSIDAKISEYETLKEIDKAIQDARASADESSEQYKQYRESLRQMEDAVVTYTANLEMFDIQMKPALERASIEKGAAEDEAQKFIDEYRNNIAVDFKQISQPLLTK